MGTIRICDWLKTQMAKGAPTYILKVDSKEFEISTEAKAQLLSRLESSTIEPLGRPPIPPCPAPVPQVRLEAAPPAGIDQESEESAFDGPSQSDLDAVSPPLQKVAPIAIPTSTKERLATPTPDQVNAVIAESTRFESRGLKTLSPGKSRQLAAKKLQEIEERKEAAQKQRSAQFREYKE
jgi:hypothetical protein